MNSQSNILDSSIPWRTPLVQRFGMAIALNGALVVNPGCADPNAGSVTGTVKVDGEPAKTGAVSLIPVGGMAGTAGAVITDGAYKVEKVDVGEYYVQVRVSKVVGQQKLYDTSDSPVQPIMAEVLPPRFNVQTELRLTVQARMNEQDYELTTK